MTRDYHATSTATRRHASHRSYQTYRNDAGHLMRPVPNGTRLRACIVKFASPFAPRFETSESPFCRYRFRSRPAPKGLRNIAQGQSSLSETTLDYRMQIGKQTHRFASTVRVPAAFARHAAARLRTTAPQTTIDLLNRVPFRPVPPSYSAASAAAATSAVSSRSSRLCAMLMNPVSNWLGAKYTPWSRQ